MSKDVWTEWATACEELHEQLRKLSSRLQKDAEATAQRATLEAVEDTWSLTVLKTDFRDLTVGSHHHTLREKFLAEELYNPLPLNDIFPDQTLERYRFLKQLKDKGIFIRDQCHLILYTRVYGNNIESLHFGWLVPSDGRDDTVHLAAQKKCEKMSPKYHSRLLKRKFVEIAETLNVSCSKAKLRRLYTVATSDASGGRTSQENSLDERVLEYIELQDEDIVTDLRQLNHRPAVYDEFFDHAAKYIDEQVTTSVDDRRQDTVVHLAKAMSANDLHKWVY